MVDTPIEDGGFPINGQPFIVKSETTFRWMPYVDPSKAGKALQEINGVKGRWQVMDINGEWYNCEKPPKGTWRPNE